MSPNTTKFKVADLGITGHPKGIDEFALLFDWEKNIALHAENEDWCGCKGTQTLS